MVAPEDEFFEPLFNHIGYYIRLNIMSPGWRDMITTEREEDWEGLEHSCVGHFELFCQRGACVYQYSLVITRRML